MFCLKNDTLTAKLKFLSRFSPTIPHLKIALDFFWTIDAHSASSDVCESSVCVLLRSPAETETFSYFRICDVSRIHIGLYSQLCCKSNDVVQKRIVDQYLYNICSRGYQCFYNWLEYLD